MSEALRSEGGAEAHLPPFSTFVGDMAENEQRILAADARLLDPGWEYYERGDAVSVIASQAQYRPWESMPITVGAKDAILRAGFSSPLDYQSVTLQPINKLPSFQSQFQTFPETTVIPETGLPSVTPVPVTASPTPSASPSQLTQLTQLTTPSSPAHLTTLAQVTPLSTTLTTLSPVNATTFHTLTAVNARSYPIVPAPLQARELAPAGQAYIDDRHIQLYQPNIATINAFPTQNGILHQNGTILHQNGSLLQNIQSPTVVHVLKNEPFDMKSLQEKYTPNGLHHSNFQNPMLIDSGYEKKNGFGSGSSPTRSDFRKKERRKMRANSSESDGSNMEMGSESSGQVAAVSSTAGFKSPLHGAPPMSTGPMELDDISSEKQTKKKRKRCGECIGCQRKDNCGDCAPCRNDKSHQICKQRRCEKLTEKKELSQEKKERRCTGGGPPPPKPSDTSEWLCSIMGESIVGLPSTHDSDFILDNTSQLKGEEAQQSVALPNIEEEMSTIESYTDGHNDGVISDVPQIVQILDVQDNEETQETDKFDTSTPFAMLRKPVSKPLEPTNRKRKLIFTPLETRKKIVAVANEKELYIKKKGVRDQQLLEFAEEEHRKNMQLHELELGFKKKLHELLLKKAAIEVEIEEEKLKKLKAENK